MQAFINTRNDFGKEKTDTRDTLYLLSLGSFFSQHGLLDTLWGQLFYTLTP